MLVLIKLERSKLLPLGIFVRGYGPFTNTRTNHKKTELPTTNAHKYPLEPQKEDLALLGMPKKKDHCASPESNRGPNDGNVGFYH